MTAYVNDEQKKEGAYGKAVKATLAATLPEGMVPAAAAFAEKGQAEAASEGGVERLSVSPESAFKAGKVTAAEDNEGNAIADHAKVAFVADGEAHFVMPTEFTPRTGHGRRRRRQCEVRVQVLRPRCQRANLHSKCNGRGQ